MKKYIKLALLIIWLGVIYFFSSQKGSTSLNQSNGLLEIIANILCVKNIDGFVLKFGSLIRKLAHFTEFFVLGFLLCINLQEYTNRNIIVISTILCALYATSDEIHQLYTEGRIFSFVDILIDTLGALVSSFLTHLIAKYVAKRKSAELWNSKSN